MENLLNPDFGLTFFTVTVFLCLVFVLGKYAWKPMLQILDERENGIRRAISDAEFARKSAEELKAQNEAEWVKAREKTDALIKQAKADAEKIRAELIHKAEEDAKRVLDQAQRQLDEDRAKLSRDLQQEVATLSVRVAEKLMRHAMNAKEQERLVGEFLTEVKKESASH